MLITSRRLVALGVLLGDSSNELVDRIVDSGCIVRALHGWHKLKGRPVGLKLPTLRNKGLKLQVDSIASKLSRNSSSTHPGLKVSVRDLLKGASRSH